VAEAGGAAPAVTRVVVAPAPFKGALPASSAARAIAAGVRLALPGAVTVALPVADGGEGTLEALVAATGGRRRGVTVSDPLGRSVEAALGELAGGVAVIELAQAAGYERLTDRERDPEVTTTRGVGEMIRAALDLGLRRIIVGLGGSATTDGGLGLALALGVRALDAAGEPLAGRGSDMARVACIDLSGRDPRLDDTAIQVACDVDNPFHGPRGAACVFGPQKGADPDGVARLDRGLASLAGVIRETTGTDLQALPGAGAAGGAAGGLAALLGAELTPGAPLVLDALGFAERLEGADLCITGEGRLDETSAGGKAPVAVAGACAAAGIPCVALCGSVALGPGAVRRLGFTAAMAIGRAMRPLPDALAAAEEDLAAAAAAVASIWAAGRRGEG
jgi:glycerate 2-kinase